MKWRGSHSSNYYAIGITVVLGELSSAFISRLSYVSTVN